MKPAVVDKRLGRLTLEQYLGLSEGITFKVAGRMLTLAGEYTNDVIALHEEASDPRRGREALMRLARAATCAETSLAQLLVLAAQHCRERQLIEVPEAIRSNIATAAHCRSAICLKAISAERQFRDERLAV